MQERTNAGYARVRVRVRLCLCWYAVYPRLQDTMQHIRVVLAIALVVRRGTTPPVAARVLLRVPGDQTRGGSLTLTHMCLGGYSCRVVEVVCRGRT